MPRIKYKEGAGLEVKRGRPSTGIKPEKGKLIQLYIQESRSIREISAVMGCSKDVVHYWLKKFGIESRTKSKRSKLLKYSLFGLKDGVKERGIRGYARQLGLNPSTLSRFLRSQI